MDKKREYYTGTGRRKEAVAQVRLYKGKGPIIVNGKPFDEVFVSDQHKNEIREPFEVVGMSGKYHADIRVAGGGISGQSGAIAHGLSRAFLRANEKFRTSLRETGLLTRDPRTKERKKPGLKRARKAPQYTKR
jgi:small subunit ribosomal protein S9